MEFKPDPSNKFHLGDKVQVKNDKGNWGRKVSTVTAVPGQLNAAYAGGQFPRGNYQLDHSDYFNRREQDLRLAVAPRRRRSS